MLEAHDELGSTNDRLKEILGQGADHFSVVIAESQSAGRGRQGEVWHSPPGSGLWMSVLVPASRASVTSLPLIVGLAAARAVERVAPGIEAGIEWPNDVMVGGKKVAGVLCEAASGSSAGSGEGVVAGIGINVRTPAGGFALDIVSRATSLETDVVAPVSRAALAGACRRSKRDRRSRPARPTRSCRAEYRIESAPARVRARKRSRRCAAAGRCNARGV